MHIALPIAQSLLITEGPDFVRELVEQEIRKQITSQHPGYAAGALRCLGIYYSPDTKRPHEQAVMAMYFYSLIRAPRTA